MKPPFHRNDEPDSFDKPDKQRELEEELASHLKMSQQDRQDRGESAQQAAKSARREFGNVALVEHVTRDQWRGRRLRRIPARSPLRRAHAAQKPRLHHRSRC